MVRFFSGGGGTQPILNRFDSFSKSYLFEYRIEMHYSGSWKATGWAKKVSLQCMCAKNCKNMQAYFFGPPCIGKLLSSALYAWLRKRPGEVVHGWKSDVWICTETKPIRNRIDSLSESYLFESLIEMHYSGSWKSTRCAKKVSLQCMCAKNCKNKQAYFLTHPVGLM